MRMLTDNPPRLTKKQRLFQRQKEFYCRGSSVSSIPEYNSLQDQHSLHYFLKNPVKKNLKNLLKAVSLQPQTQKRMQTMKSLNHLLNINQNKKKKHLATIGFEKEQPQKSKYDKQYIEIPTFNRTDKNSVKQKILADPYLEACKPSILDKKKKFKLQILKRKEKSFKQKFIDENMVKFISKQKRQPERKSVELESLNFKRRHSVVSFSKRKYKQKYVNSQSFLKFLSQKKQKIQQNMLENEYEMNDFQA